VTYPNESTGRGQGLLSQAVNHVVVGKAEEGRKDMRRPTRPLLWPDDRAAAGSCGRASCGTVRQASPWSTGPGSPQRIGNGVRGRSVPDSTLVPNTGLRRVGENAVAARVMSECRVGSIAPRRREKLGSTMILIG